MVWIIGIAGLIFGFIAGLAMIKIWLRDTSRDDLISDKSIHLTYGLFVWIMAAIGAVMAVYLYKHYF